MNLLYIGYWGANEGLSKASIYPHLEILCNSHLVSKIVYVSLERGRNPDNRFVVPSHIKLVHKPLYIEKLNIRFLNKLWTMISLPSVIDSIAIDYKVDLTIARSSLAGIFAHHQWKKRAIPYCVESFEPHAEYMLESGVWSKYGFSYNLQKYWEKAQLKHALKIFPVSYNYKEELLRRGVEAKKIEVVPCSVGTDRFKFSLILREKVRNNLNIPKNGLVGIYVGKFGGIYLEDFAYKIFHWLFEMAPNFYLLILTPQEERVITEKLRSHGENRIFVRSVKHSEVGAYLSAADFAMGLYKTGNSMRYLSPIKVGEYWANGLPVLLTEGTGDDSDIIKKTGKGVIFRTTEDSVKLAISELLKLLKKPDRSNSLAKQFRNRDFVETAYTNLLLYAKNQKY